MTTNKRWIVQYYTQNEWHVFNRAETEYAARQVAAKAILHTKHWSIRIIKSSG